MLRQTSTIPDVIAAHIESHHVLGLCVCDEEGLWAASCFYVFDAHQGDLVILTDAETRHGKQMIRDPLVAGLIAGQPVEIHEIRGLQFTARAALLPEAEREDALELYACRHPVSRTAEAEVWRLQLQTLKFTDNRVSFGHKTYWSRSKLQANQSH